MLLNADKRWRGALCVCCFSSPQCPGDALSFSHILSRNCVNMNVMYAFCSLSCVVEDVEEAFVKTPDARPLLLYLRTGDRKGEKEEPFTLNPATRDLLERVNKADRSAKLKVEGNYP